MCRGDQDQAGLSPLPGHPLKIIDAQLSQTSNEISAKCDKRDDEYRDARVGERGRQHEQQALTSTRGQHDGNLFRSRHDRSHRLFLFRRLPCQIGIAVQLPGCEE